jgi:Replication-relaxation
LKVKEIVRSKRFGAEDVLRIASHLTERDRHIALECYEHRVLTTSQIKRLYFSGTRSATARLDMLYSLRVLDRFRPSVLRGEGTAPYHWVIDEGGALLVADQRGIDRVELGWQHSAAVGVANSQKLAHHVEANEFFVRVAVDANDAGAALSEWYGEKSCHHMFSGVVVADGYGVLDLPDRAPLHFLIELDRGTEASARVRKKAEDYARMLPHTELRDLDPIVLFLVPSARRAETIRAALRDIDAPLAVEVWSEASTESALDVLTAAATRRRAQDEHSAGVATVGDA